MSFQRARAENGFGDFGGANDEYIRLPACDFGSQRIVFKTGFGGYVAAGVLQALDAGLFEFIGYEYAHDCMIYPTRGERLGAGYGAGKSAAGAFWSATLPR